MSVGAIWAQARDAAGRPVIGRDGDMPWHLPGDLAHFQQVTKGASVIMGRKTWESLPPRFRPLPGRFNVVLTTGEGPREAASASSMPAAMELIGAEDFGSEIWIIGGSSLFAAALGFAQRLEVTEIDLEVEGDTYAPAIPASDWMRAQESDWQQDGDGPRYRFVSYRKADAHGTRA